MKRCRKCKLLLPASEFYHRPKESKDGLYSYCKRCHNAASTKAKRTNMEGYRAWRREYRKRDREKQSDYQRMYRLRKKRKAG